mmetsp:Transcript_5702/g.13146  ORF Transcript_5702/g.13146 Transcript_5702/m.13146 type:complete len:336 (-) Transcript_5702:83-1090(-)
MGISFESTSANAHAACGHPKGSRSKARWADLSDEVEEDNWPEPALDFFKVQDALDTPSESKTVDSLDSLEEVCGQHADNLPATATAPLQDWWPDSSKTLLSSTYRAKGRGLRWAVKAAKADAKAFTAPAHVEATSGHHWDQKYDHYSHHYNHQTSWYSGFYTGKAGRAKAWRAYDSGKYADAPASEACGQYVDKYFEIGEGARDSQYEERSERNQKRQCQFIIGIEEDPMFRVGRRLLGPNGSHMKAIAAKTGCRLRLRGRGSWFLEGPNQEESSDPLMLCVSSPSEKDHLKAVHLIEELLRSVYAEFQDFCEKEGWPVPELRVRRNEGARKGAR